jgi:hypothetical protein
MMSVETYKRHSISTSNHLVATLWAVDCYEWSYEWRLKCHRPNLRF